VVFEAWVAFGQPQVRLRSFPSGLLDLPQLDIQYVLGLPPEFFGHFRDANVVSGIASSDSEDVPFESVLMAVVADISASSEPSVASSILVGKMLISSCASSLNACPAYA
jgi:hypothetical protein